MQNKDPFGGPARVDFSPNLQFWSRDSYEGLLELLLCPFLADVTLR
jgi:hypothetical protein